jgi:ABC-type transport system involved in multi-copper enzyme maturation permease subunit
LNGLNETVVIWSAECQRTLRSTRVVALLGLYSLFSLLVFVVAAFLRSFVQEMTQSGMMTVPGEGLPLSVVVVFFFSLFFLPLYVALMGFDQVSGEVGPRSIRYLTVRARRSSVLFGKLLAQATVLLSLVFVLDLGLCVYTWLTTPGFGPADFGLHLLRFWLASTVFSFAFLSLTSLCSCLTTSSPVSLILNLSVLLFSIVLWMTTLADEGNPLRYLRYLSPLMYSLDLLNPELQRAALSIVAYAVFTLLFLGSALTALRTRDL